MAAIAKTTLPGRFQSASYDGLPILLDGAHNEAAALVLARTLIQERPGVRFTLITGMVEGHDPSGFYGKILPFADRVICPPIDFHRAVAPDSLAEAISSVRPDVHVSTAGSIVAALQEAKVLGSEALVTGSFYLVGEVGNALKGI